VVPPVDTLQQSIAEILNLNSELLVLLLVFGLTSLLLPAGVTLLAGWLARLLTNTVKKYTLRQTVAAFAPAFVPVGLGVWIAHYTFHLLIGIGTIIPVFQEFIGLPGEWARFGGVSDLEIIGMVQVVGIVGGLLWSLMIAQRVAQRLYRREAVFGLLPWALVLIAVAVIAVWIFGLPMEMRGSALFS
jgi:hypothetical protein